MRQVVILLKIQGKGTLWNNKMGSTKAIKE